MMTVIGKRKHWDSKVLGYGVEGKDEISRVGKKKALEVVNTLCRYDQIADSR